MSEVFDTDGQQELSDSADWYKQIDGVRNTIRNSQYAGGVTTAVRQNPAMSKDMTAAFTMAGLDANNPELAATVRADYQQSSLLAQVVNQSIGRATRPLTAMFYDTWDTSVTQWLRMGADIGQQYDRYGTVDPRESYLASGSSMGGQAAHAMRQGEQTVPNLLFGEALGTGLIAGRPRSMLEHQGAGTAFENALREGATVDEAMVVADKYVADRYGADIVNRAYESAELTQLHVTFNGVDYGYGTSLGRLAATPLFMMELVQPKSIPANIFSGVIDGTTQIFLDPWDPLFNQATRLYKSTRALRPHQVSTIEEAIELQGGVPLAEKAKRGPYHNPTRAETLGQSAEGWVFHGGGRVEADLTSGGISHDLTRSLGYAVNNHPPGEGVVYALKVDELPQAVQDTLLEVGEIEQFVHLDKVIPVEELDGYVEVILETQELQRLNDEAMKAFDIELEGNLEYSQWLDDFTNEEISRIERLYPGEAAEAYMTPEQFARYNELIDEGADLHGVMGEIHYEMMGLSKEQTASINYHAFGAGGSATDVLGSYSLPTTRVLEVADVEEMLEKGYLFPDGKASMDEAYRMLDEDLQVVRDHGRFVPKSPEEYLETPNGQKLVNDFIDPDIPEYVKIEKLRAAGVPYHDIYRALESVKRGTSVTARKARASEHVGAWINGRRLTEYTSIPRGPKAQTAIMSSINKMTGETRMPPPKRRIGDWGRRWAAASSVSRLDPWDFDANFQTIVNALDTLGASPQRVDDILREAWDAMDDPEAMKGVLGSILDEYKAALIRQGYEPEEVMKAFDEYYSLQNSKTMYNINQVAAPLAEPDTFFEMRNTSSGLSYRVLLDQAVLDSEMSLTHIHVPSLREMRQATSRGRKIRNSMKDSPVLFDESVATAASHVAFSAWRNMQLLRMGWMASVIPDEIARAFAQGHSEALGNPIFLWNLMMTNLGQELPDGRMLRDVARAQGGLGVGSFLVGPGDVPFNEAFSTKTSAWVDVDTMDAAGKITYAGSQQLARNYSVLYNSKLAKQLWEFDGDIARTVDYLMNHPNSPLPDILSGRSTGAIPGQQTRLGKIAKMGDDVDGVIELLTTNLEVIDARMHLLAGGDWVKRDLDNVGQWVNSGGAPVNTYVGASTQTGKDGRQLQWNKNTLIREVFQRDPNAANVYSLNGHRVTADDLRIRLMEDDGIRVDLINVPASQQYVKVKPANQDLLNLMGNGKMARGERTADSLRIARRRSLIEAGETAGIKEGDQIYMVQVMDGEDVKSVAFYATAQRAYGSQANSGTTRTLIVDSKSLSGEQFMHIQTDHIGSGPVWGDDLADLAELLDEGNPIFKQIDIDAVNIRASEIDEAGEVVHLFDEMTVEDSKEFAEFMRTQAFSNEYSPPGKVRGPSDAVAGDPEIIDSFIRDLFTLIGQKPSEVLARNPYSAVRAWETAADYYLWATPAIRREIRAAATRAKLKPKDFDRLIRRSVRLQGLDEIPKVPAAKQIPMNEIQDIMVARAIKDTRDLFFDLSKRGNWADALKLIFPFGDAWWEVLSRWGKLMNPLMTPEFGKPFRNIRRAQQFNMAATRSGWYDTNLQGERVFTTYPGPALVAKLLNLLPEGVVGTDIVAVGTIGFLNFADTRSVLAPGTSPLVQFGGALFRPLIEDNPKLMDIFNTAIYGGFQPSTMKDGMASYLLPTYLKNLGKWLTAGEYDEEFASLQIDIANAMVASDPKWENVGQDIGLLEELMLEARSDASTFGFIKIFSSFMLPAQPQLAIEAIRMGQMGEPLVTPSAIANDYAFLTSFMEQDEALETVRSWYGSDPLAVARKTYAINSRPLTKSGYNMLQKHPDAPEILPFTVAAFMPPTAGEEFYSEEYQRQLDDNDRQKLTLRQSYQLLSYKQGQLRMQEVKDERDRAVRNAEAIYGKESDTYLGYIKNVISPWYNSSKRSIEAMYFGYGKGGGGPAGITKRATFEQLKDEMLHTGTLGTRENEMGRELNPELTQALQEIAGWWIANDELSIQMGHEAGWWYAGTASTDWTTAGIRSEFTARIHRLIARIEDETLVQQVKWYTDYIVTPLMSGYNIDNPFIVTVDPVLIPEG